MNKTMPTHAGVLMTVAALLPVAVGQLPPQYALYVGAFFGCCAQIAAVLPAANPAPATWDSKLYAGFRAVLDLCAHNYGGAVPKTA